MTHVSLGDFHTLVEDALGRSTSVTSLIPLRVRMAAAWLEKNYTFQYMRQWRTLEVLAAAEYPHIISLHNINIKRVELLRRRMAAIPADGGYVFSDPLKSLKPQDRSRRGYGVPESYWKNGMSSLVLNSIPTENMTFEANLVEFTNWGSGSTWTHWLLDNATQLLLARTLMILGSTRLRDPKLWETYKAEFDLEIQAMGVAQEDIQEVEVVSTWEQPEPYEYGEQRAVE